MKYTIDNLHLAKSLKGDTEPHIKIAKPIQRNPTGECNICGANTYGIIDTWCGECRRAYEKLKKKGLSTKNFVANRKLQLTNEGKE